MLLTICSIYKYNKLQEVLYEERNTNLRNKETKKEMRSMREAVADAYATELSKELSFLIDRGFSKKYKNFDEFLGKYWKLVGDKDALLLQRNLRAGVASDVTLRNFCLNRGLMIDAAYSGRVIYYLYNRSNSKFYNR